MRLNGFLHGASGLVAPAGGDAQWGDALALTPRLGNKVHFLCGLKNGKQAQYGNAHGDHSLKCGLKMGLKKTYDLVQGPMSFTPNAKEVVCATRL